MTTLQQPHEVDRVHAALRFVAGRWWWVKLGERLLAWLAGSAGLLIVLSAVAGFLPLGSTTRWMMLALLIVLPAAALLSMVVWPLRHRLTPAEAARQIETRLDGLENRYINAVQLSAEADSGSLFDRELVSRVIHEIAMTTSDVPVSRAVTTRRLGWTAMAAGGVAVVMLLFAMLGGGRFAYGLERLLHPGLKGWVGRIHIDHVSPGDVTLPIGARMTVEVTASTTTRLAEEPRARLWIRHEGESDFVPMGLSATRPLALPGQPGVYVLPFTSVAVGFDYYVSIGETVDRDRVYHVRVQPLPRVQDLSVSLTWPKYIAWEQPAKPPVGGSFEAPVGSDAQIDLTTDQPIASAMIVLAGVGEDRPSDRKNIVMTPQGSERRQWRGSLVVTQPMQYQIVCLDHEGRVIARQPEPAAGAADDAGRFYSIRALPDTPPTISITRPGQDDYVQPGGTIEIRFKAVDGHGLTAVRLMTAKVKGEANGDLATEEPTVRHAAAAAELLDKDGHPRRDAAVTYVFDLRQGPKYEKGDRLFYWVEATDNRDLRARAAVLGLGANDSGGPQTAASARYLLTVEDHAEVLAARTDTLQKLTAELLRLLKAQKDVRAATVALVHDNVAAAQFPAAAGAVKAGQFAFATDLLKLALGKVIEFDDSTRTIREQLKVLAYNDSRQARDQAGDLAQFPDAQSAADPIKQLTASQDRVIYSLESMLGLIGEMLQRAQDESQRTSGTDLPQDVRDKLKALAGELTKFIDQQKKVIAVSQSLAKTPVDDLSDADKKELEKLAALEDKWEKFLDEQIHDFSKLSEQDFSNPTLLKELIEIKTDVVMAKDALNKKAVEIAVPIEEAGAELAKETVTNIEKWLPDTPDREKWSMEEPTEQQDVPMAELPKELEDLMGPLMEQEEDLFQEMEDATSKWTDSLDKGAGWDAMDGPISNMSAKGVTGNRLPNQSEISGRSGEGREGKASGEMVEQDATGKGGRRTPTRLSEDPFQKGQVNDTSKEPPGGATGGGKLAGAAGEGLEGPTPGDVQKMQRLAQKQAAIRNKAEAVDARFRANNYNNFALRKAIEIMRDVQFDLENNRYQNALRKKAVLVNNLQAQQSMLRGDIHVEIDTSAQPPDIARKDIVAPSESELPPRYKDLAREYLKTLSDQATSGSGE
ncbi:MAG: hypothetical protein BIFFINMI_00175 [Phycisphaerae bacterium]|nr:hypothetical protein [Phycisphaerae bacterium]